MRTTQTEVQFLVLLFLENHTTLRMAKWLIQIQPHVCTRHDQITLFHVHVNSKFEIYHNQGLDQSVSWVQPVSERDTYSLETNGRRNGVEVRVCMRKVREASCLDAFEVHSLQRHRKSNERSCFSLTKVKSSFFFYLKIIQKKQKTQKTALKKRKKG